MKIRDLNQENITVLFKKYFTREMATIAQVSDNNEKYMELAKLVKEFKNILFNHLYKVIPDNVEAKKHFANAMLMNSGFAPGNILGLSEQSLFKPYNETINLACNPFCSIL